MVIMYRCVLPQSKTKKNLTVVLQSFNNKKELDFLIPLLVNKVKAKVVILEKGSLKKKDFPDTVTFHKLANKGRELGAFLWYCTRYYNSLSGSFIFASANISKHKRLSIICKLLRSRKKFMCNKKTWPWERSYDFTVEEYLNQKLLPAPVRPFGAWFEKYVGDFDKWQKTQPACYNGVFKTHASYLKKRPVLFYKRLNRQLNAHNAPEAGHYVERAVAGVFGPL